MVNINNVCDENPCLTTICDVRGGCKVKQQCLCENYPRNHKVSPCHPEAATRHPESTSRHSEAQAEESVVNREILQSHSFLQNDDLMCHSESLHVILSEAKNLRNDSSKNLIKILLRHLESTSRHSERSEESKTRI